LSYGRVGVQRCGILALAPGSVQPDSAPHPQVEDRNNLLHHGEMRHGLVQRNYQGE